MTTKRIYVTGSFTVTVDETKFTPEFFEEFSKYMFFMDTVGDAIEHLADLYARGVIDGDTKELEGYGVLAEMGITFQNDSGGNAWIDNNVDIEIRDARS